MNFTVTAVTDVGNVKEVNQDSLCVKVASINNNEQVLMAVVCDGMGGLSKGELASATVIRTLIDWFEKRLPKIINDFSWQNLQIDMDTLIKNQNQRILNYSKETNVVLGTTLSVIIAIKNKYMIAHVGDSRVYEIKEGLRQLTEDQTFISRELKRGNLTLEEAKIHPKRNMLLQCVGASKTVNPQFVFGNLDSKSTFMICSDGFRHVLSEEEMFSKLNYTSCEDDSSMETNCKSLVEIVKQRRERDNISVVLIKCEE